MAIYLKNTEKFKYSMDLYHDINLYCGDTMTILHYPRLDTILNVEHLIKKSEAPISKNGIDRKLTKKIMRPTLNVILNYLESSGKILITKGGIIWIHKEDISKKLKKKIERGTIV